jgi:hypothetical protein
MPRVPRYQVRQSGTQPTPWRVHDTRLRSIVGACSSEPAAQALADELNAGVEPTFAERVAARLSSLLFSLPPRRRKSPTQAER